MKIAHFVSFVILCLLRLLVILVTFLLLGKITSSTTQRKRVYFTQDFRGFNPWVTGSKAVMRQKGAVECNYSLVGGRQISRTVLERKRSATRCTMQGYSSVIHTDTPMCASKSLGSSQANKINNFLKFYLK